MHKFLMFFSVVVLLGCLFLFFRTIFVTNDFVALIVSVLGMLSAAFTVWTSILLQRIKKQ